MKKEILMRNLLIKDFRYNILNSAYIQINLHLHISRIDKKIKTKIKTKITFLLSFLI